ncbi:MAG TPA: PQQ-binding-like beta-propeller repeat protein [Kofleriaceae bacterium]|jgi:Ca-activated chloride channel family protein|nr:PQQ-binding-like beta-propeller repeat protein [Kofleriaceae bacterium]
MKLCLAWIAIACALGCDAHDAVDPRAAPAIAPSPPRPAPGIDLAGPIPPPDRRSAGRTGAAPASLDLAADRAVVPVAVPVPPAGGSVGFTFAEDRRGWVARIPEHLQLPAVAYGAGKIYVSGGFESVSFYGLDAETGHIDWATTNLEDNGPTAAVFEDDRVLFNTESCTLFALDARTGRRLWFRRLGDPTLAQVTTADGLVYASHPGASGQELTAYRVKDGEPVWTRPVGAELRAAPVIAGDAIYATNLHGVVFRFARRTGKLAWARALDATTAPWIADNELFITRQVRGHEQQIIVAADTGKLLREHDRSSGRSAGDVPGGVEPGNWKAVWAFEGSRPVVDRGVRYVAMGGEIRASDAATGELLWQRRYTGASADRRSVGSVALAGSEVVIAARDGTLFGLDVDTGYTLWSYAIGHRVIAEPVIARGWIYASTEDGYVVALQVGDRTLDGWHMFGGNPRHDGAVDPPTRGS